MARETMLGKQSCSAPFACSREGTPPCPATQEHEKCYGTFITNQISTRPLRGRIQQFSPQLSPGEPRCGKCVTPGAKVSPRIANMSTCGRGAFLTRGRSERLSASAQYGPGGNSRAIQSI